MVKNNEDFKEQVGEEPDGFVAQAVTLQSDEDKFLVEVPTADLNIKETERLSTNDLNIIGKIFKGLFDKFPEELDISDVSIYAEVDKDKFTDEWKVACKNPNAPGAFYKLREDEVEEDRIKYVPKVVEVTEDKSG